MQVLHRLSPENLEAVPSRIASAAKLDCSEYCQCLIRFLTMYDASSNEGLARDGKNRDHLFPADMKLDLYAFLQAFPLVCAQLQIDLGEDEANISEVYVSLSRLIGLCIVRNDIIVANKAPANHPSRSPPSPPPLLINAMKRHMS